MQQCENRINVYLTKEIDALIHEIVVQKDDSELNDDENDVGIDDSEKNVDEIDVEEMSHVKNEVNEVEKNDE